MKLKIFNFEIEEDNKSFILSEYWDIKTKEWDISYWIKSQIYPSTLTSALKRIRHKLRKKDASEVNLDVYISKIEEIDERFILEINKALKDEDTSIWHGDNGVI